MKLPEEILALVMNIISTRIHPTREDLRYASNDDEGEDWELALQEGWCPFIPDDAKVACCSRFVEMCKGRDVGWDEITVAFSKSNFRKTTDGTYGSDNDLSQRLSFTISPSSFAFKKETHNRSLDWYCDKANPYNIQEGASFVDSTHWERFVFDGASWTGMSGGCRKSGEEGYGTKTHRQNVVAIPLSDPVALFTAIKIDLSWSVQCFDKKGGVVKDYQEVDAVDELNDCDMID